jgi:hypothetical protein
MKPARSANVTMSKNTPRAIGDEERDDTDRDVADTPVDEVYDHVHVPFLLDEINKMNMVQLRIELKLRQQAVTGRKL